MVDTAVRGLPFTNEIGQNAGMGESTRAAMIPLSAEMIGIVGRALVRSTDRVHEEMKDAVNSLANIAYIAPWLGLFATVLTIPNSFKGFDGPKSLGLAIVTAGLSISMWPTALGLLVGLTSLSFHKYLVCALDTFDGEMKCTSLDLVNQLVRHRGPWTVGPPMKHVGSGPIFGAEPVNSSTRE
jgi:biopolymer transport protein ExbB